MILRYFFAIEKFIKGLPLIRSVPGFNTLPEKITHSNLRFYKVCNLVLTLGMFVHLSWIVLFLWLEAYQMAIINMVGFAVYVFSIIINRKGYHFTSSVIMVVEIITHQVIAVNFFGWDAGFQYYVVVITLFPFLMPQGKWVLKSVVLVASLTTFIIMDYLYKTHTPLFALTPAFLNYFRISNIAFSFIFMDISGAYFNSAVHETEEQLAKKTEELVASEKNATLGKIATEMAHEIQNPLNFVTNFSEINEELLTELKEALEKPGNETQLKALVADILSNNERVSANGKRISDIVKTLQQRANAL